MKRDRIEKLIYSGRSAQHFTQDTPILPDVWIEYAVHPGAAKRLLLTPWQGPGLFHTTPGLLSVVVRQRLEAKRCQRRSGQTKTIEVSLRADFWPSPRASRLQ